MKTGMSMARLVLTPKLLLYIVSNLVSEVSDGTNISVGLKLESNPFLVYPLVYFLPWQNSWQEQLQEGKVYCSSQLEGSSQREGSPSASQWQSAPGEGGSWPHCLTLSKHRRVSVAAQTPVQGGPGDGPVTFQMVLDLQSNSLGTSPQSLNPTKTNMQDDRLPGQLGTNKPVYFFFLVLFNQFMIRSLPSNSFKIPVFTGQ